MPLYDYICSNKHVTEQRQPISISQVGCPVCGDIANRAPFYQSQFINCETGPKGGLRNPIPPDQQSYKQEFSEFVEATGEVTHTYEKAGKTPPDFVAKAKAKARKLGAKIN